MLAISGALSEFSYKLNECMTNKSTYKCVIHAELSNHTAVNVTLYKHQSLAHLHNILAEALNPPVKPVINSNIELTHMTKSSSSSSSSLSTDTYDYESCDYSPNHSPNSAVAPVSSKRVEENGDERCKSKFSDYTPPLALRSIEIYDIFVYNGNEVKQIKATADEPMTVFENPMQKKIAQTRTRELNDVVGVPLPPSDWEGYADPKYKAQREKEQRIFKYFEEKKKKESQG